MLTSKQRSRLSALATKLEPVAALGRGGLSEGVIDHLKAELDRRELLKLRFADFKGSRDDYARELAEKAGCELVRVIGNVAIFFRRHPDPEKRTVDLPGLS